MVWPFEGMHWTLRSVGWILPLTLTTESFRSIAMRGWGMEHFTVYAGFISSLGWSVFFILGTYFLVVINKNNIEDDHHESRLDRQHDELDDRMSEQYLWNQEPAIPLPNMQLEEPVQNPDKQYGEAPWRRGGVTPWSRDGATPWSRSVGLRWSHSMESWWNCSVESLHGVMVELLRGVIVESLRGVTPWSHGGVAPWSHSMES
ncbi:unnamed protein product [Nesidiocoris tenuis]|uniref:Uncharacterized protein n=1 Tax=Nesidiocoris tenuis TaxID=355587 RepID=A0A6H5GY70_9HEMI|nr:unnamed protein product [Nesidiocoris tenuis]